MHNFAPCTRRLSSRLLFTQCKRRISVSWHAKQALLQRPPTDTAVCRSTTGKSLVDGPPQDYDHRASIYDSSVAFIKERYPQLLDLVERGALVVYLRPPDYVERREDGYREPEEVLVVGTAHVASRSADDVQRVVTAVKPEAVVVELCRSRSALLDQPLAPGGAPPLHQGQTASTSKTGQQQQQAPPPRPQAPPSPLAISGGSYLAALMRSLQLGGQSALVLRLLLSGAMRRVEGQMGVIAGGEFVAARLAAEAVGAQVVLGDRPIEITLQRAWSALPLSSRLKLCTALLQAALGRQPADLNQLTQAQVEQLMEDDAVGRMFAEAGRAFPELMSPLVHERDLYLAWSLKRSKAVNGTKTVVGVVGKGHLRGVVYALTADNGRLRFADLVDGKNNRSGAPARLARRLAFDALIGAGLYLAWLGLQAALPA